MKRAALVLAALSALSGVAACSSIRSTYDSWFGAPVPSSKPSPLPSFSSTVTTRALWQGRVPGVERNVLFPAVQGNTVWAAGANGEIVGFNAGSGAQEARFNAGQRLAGGVAVNERVVVISTHRGEIQALDRTGKTLWKMQAPGETLAPAAIDSNLVIARVGDGAVLGLDLASGKQRWLYQRSAPALSVRSFGGVALSRGVVFAGFAGGRLIALSSADGSVLWDSVVALPKGTTELERVADITSPPVVDDNRVCAVAFQGRLACFDPARGTAIWARDLSSFSGMGSDSRNVYVTDDKGAITALDKSTGGSVWKQDKLAGRGVTRPLALGRFVVVGDYQGYVHLLSREDGAFAGRVATDGSAIAAPPVALDLSSIAVQTRNGGVYAFALQ